MIKFYGNFIYIISTESVKGSLPNLKEYFILTTYMTSC